MKAIRVHEVGGPEKLVWEDLPLPEPRPGEARVQIQAIGLNFIDVYHRTGLYKVPLPFVPGMEAAGIVDAVGSSVSTVSAGDRVAYAMSLGSYAEYALVDPSKLVRIPDSVDFECAAALMLQGMTAHYLALSTYPLHSGETALVHAAAGGVGLLLVQIAKMLGARVIGAVSTPEKAALATAAGADAVVLYETADLEEQVRNFTRNQGADVVYDSVGQSTFDKSLKCLRRRGMLVLYGQSSGPVPPLDLTILNARGSVYVTRPSLAHYSATRDELEWRSGDMFRWVSEGKVQLKIDRVLPLKEAAEAHRALEGRQTSGKVVLKP